jgi:hypothetical protein
MYFRCAECHDSTWIPNLAPGESLPPAHCQRCGREYALKDDYRSTQARYEAAMGCAETNQLDLPSAYSVLFGIMSLDEAKEFRDGREEKAAAGRRSSARSRATPAAIHITELPAMELVYDPEFQPAVEEGHLTPKQAIERGSRQALAVRMAKRHDLPIELALDVADNRLTVREALAKRPRPKPEIIIPPEPATPSQIAFVGWLAAVLAVLIGVFGWVMWKRDLSGARPESQPPATDSAVKAEPAPAPSAADLLSLTDVETDKRGRLTRVTGPNPRTVLLAYCRANPRAAQLEPIGLAAAIPPFPGTQLGLFRDIGQENSIRAFTIRKDGKTGRWVAGNGRRPITIREFEELPANTYEVASN